MPWEKVLSREPEDMALLLNDKQGHSLTIQDRERQYLVVTCLEKNLKKSVCVCVCVCVCLCVTESRCYTPETL